MQHINIVFNFLISWHLDTYMYFSVFATYLIYLPYTLAYNQSTNKEEKNKTIHMAIWEAWEIEKMYNLSNETDSNSILKLISNS